MIPSDVKLSSLSSSVKTSLENGAQKCYKNSAKMIRIFKRSCPDLVNCMFNPLTLSAMVLIALFDPKFLVTVLVGCLIGTTAIVFYRNVDAEKKEKAPKVVYLPAPSAPPIELASEK